VNFVSGLIDEGVTDERPVKACRYVPKALYSGGESYVGQSMEEREIYSLPPTHVALLLFCPWSSRYSQGSRPERRIMTAKGRWGKHYVRWQAELTSTGIKILATVSLINISPWLDRQATACDACSRARPIQPVAGCSLQPL
jgi:hypothetical protein